jgi:RHS repeat-associated protein
MLEAAKEEISVWPTICGESVLPLVADPTLFENRIGAKSQLAENSRQGFELRSSTLRWGGSDVKSKTALGLRGVLYDECIRSRCTGKERDTESGNDYFEARYYSSAMGRFMSPDWTAKEEGDDPVPYANLEDPQSLNLYAYVRNNPLSKADPDGHCAEDACVVEGGAALVTVAVVGAIALEAGAVAYNNSPEGQRSWSTFSSGVSDSFSSNISSIKNKLSNVFSKKDAPAADGKANTGPKAATAPGVTAGGQATDEHGNKVGPSGKNQVDQVDKGSKKGAKDAARNAGQGAPEKHPSPTKGDPHYHPTDADGNKKPNSTHYNY